MRSKKKDINILVLNCGSSSLKYKILRMPDGEELVQGEAERVGIQDTRRFSYYAFHTRIKAGNRGGSAGP